MVDQAVQPAEGNIGSATIKVVGVGGNGSNAVSRMYRDRIPEVEYITVNTDAQALTRSDVPVRIRVGDRTARGLGVGGDLRRVANVTKKTATNSNRSLMELILCSSQQEWVVEPEPVALLLSLR